MFKVISIGIVALMAVFCGVGAYSNQPIIVDDEDEEMYIAAIMKSYPASDEKHQFASALKKSGKLMSDCTNNENFFLAYPIFSIMNPFLKSNNEKIKLCAEDLLRFVKSGINLFMLISPPDDASAEEVKIALENIKKLSIKLRVSSSDFLLSYSPELQSKKAIGKDEKKNKSSENVMRFKNVDKQIWLGDSRLSIVDELFKLNEKGIGYNYPLFHEILDFLNKNKYVTSSQYNDLVRIYYEAKDD